jgi:hypothetical protein
MYHGQLERFYLDLICCGASVPADLGRPRRCAAQNTSSILALLAPRAPNLDSASCASRQSTQEKTALGIFLAVAFSIIILTANCAEPKPDTFAILNRAVTEDGEALPGLQISANGKAIGETDETGSRLIGIEGRSGDKVVLSAACPKGYRSQSQSRTVALLHITGLDKKKTGASTEVSWRCSPLMRTAVLVVRAPGQPNLPITIHGHEVGRTNLEGIAHILLTEPPGSSIAVSLDTKDCPNVRPQNPVRAFRLKDRDMIFIFDQQFTNEKTARPKRSKKPMLSRTIPYKIGN